MDWLHTLTIIASSFGTYFAFYKLSRENTAALKEDLKENNRHWREMFIYMNNQVNDKEGTHELFQQ